MRLDNEGKLYDKQLSKIEYTGMFRVSSTLNRFISDFYQNGLALVSMDGSKPMVVEAKVKAKEDNKQELYLYIPYHDKERVSKEVDMVITNPDREPKTEFKVIKG